MGGNHVKETNRNKRKFIFFHNETIGFFFPFPDITIAEISTKKCCRLLVSFEIVLCIFLEIV